MVAGDGHVVAHVVHQADDGFARGHGADGFPLDGVAIVHQGLAVIIHGRAG